MSKKRRTGEVVTNLRLGATSQGVTRGEELTDETLCAALSRRAGAGLMCSGLSERSRQRQVCGHARDCVWRWSGICLHSRQQDWNSDDENCGINFECNNNFQMNHNLATTLARSGLKNY